VELFGIGDDEWLPVASEGTSFSAKILFHESCSRRQLAGSVEELSIEVTCLSPWLDP